MPASEFSSDLYSFFRRAFLVFLKNHRLLPRLLPIVWHQRLAFLRRRHHPGIPPLVIFSITSACNLRCRGCYFQSQHRQETNLSTARIKKIFLEFKELGVSVVLVAGGEPFSRPDLPELIKLFPEILFIVFTNGTLLNDNLISQIKPLKNLVPVISLEGSRTLTNNRRGQNIYESTLKTLSSLKTAHLPFGLSFTVTQKNFSHLSNLKFIQSFVAAGCSLFFMVEYVPFEKGTEGLCLTLSARQKFLKTINHFKKSLPALFVNFPGDEDKYGGCLAAGRGFVHISPSGNLEPCPFSPYSDTNLNKISFRHALKSSFLEKIRSLPEDLRETAGGCALFKSDAKIKKLLK